jgi:hypothetical protein
MERIQQWERKVGMAIEGRGEADTGELDLTDGVGSRVGGFGKAG